MVHDAPEARESGVTGQSAPWANSAASGPSRWKVEIVSGPGPALESVTAWALLLVPSVSSPNESEAGETLAAGGPRLSVPTPLSGTLCGLSEASSPISSVADFWPAVSGENET